MDEDRTIKIICVLGWHLYFLHGHLSGYHPTPYVRNCMDPLLRNNEIQIYFCFQFQESRCLKYLTPGQQSLLNYELNPMKTGAWVFFPRDNAF